MPTQVYSRGIPDIPIVVRSVRGGVRTWSWQCRWWEERGSGTDEAANAKRTEERQRSMIEVHLTWPRMQPCGDGM
jgi:hypothetical protein